MTEHDISERLCCIREWARVRDSKGWENAVLDCRDVILACDLAVMALEIREDLHQKAWADWIARVDALRAARSAALAKDSGS